MDLAFVATTRDIHPVDLIEQIINEHDWLFERHAEDEISLCVEGDQTDYQLSFLWMDAQEALHLGCAFELSVSEGDEGEMNRLLLLINEKLLMGHFDYWTQTNVVVYRQALLLTGGLYPSQHQIEQLIDNAVGVCESYYQAFHLVATTKISAENALRYSLFETLGNA